MLLNDRIDFVISDMWKFDKIFHKISTGYFIAVSYTHLDVYKRQP